MKIEQAIVAKVLAKTCVQVVLTRLEGNDETRQFLRLKNFSIDVFQEFVTDFSERCLCESLEDIALRIPYEAELKCDPKFRIAKDSTITFARNDKNLKKLVYLETQEGSDSQSTKDFFTIRDSDLLHSIRDTDAVVDVVKTLVDVSAVESVSKSPANALLVECLGSVLKTLLKEKVEISTPRFVAFVYACTAELGKSTEPVDANSLKGLVGKNFSQMELFNDTFWHEREKAVGMRLKSNALYADLAKSDTQEMDVEREIKNARNTLFVGDDGEEFTAVEQGAWRDLCVEYMSDPRDKNRHKIPYYIFTQIFKKKSKGFLLGDLIHQEIIDVDRTRENEFVGLGVQDGLNANSQEAAVIFLESESEAEHALPLKDLLNLRSRKRIERLVTPKTSTFFNPLIQIARVLTLFSDGNGEQEVPLQLKVILHESPVDPSPTLGLFNFLFGRLLAELAAFSTDTNSLVEFDVDTDLMSTRPFPTEPVDGDPDWVLKWEHLVLRFDILKQDASGSFEIERSEFFSWLPERESIEYLFLWWGLVSDPSFRGSIRSLQFPSDIHIEQFRESFMLGHRAPNEIVMDELACGNICPAEIDEFKAARKEFLDDIAQRGLHFDVMSNFVDQACETAKTVRGECIPNNSWEREPYQFLASDTVITEDKSSIFILPSNAVKARWISDYLRETYKLAERSIQSQVPLNEENGDLYFNWIESLSSSQQPATAVDSQGNLYESHSEKGWGEYMVPIRSSDETSFSTVTPAAILEAVCNKVVQYLHHHPHKLDGLTLTVVSKRDASFGSRLIGMLRKGEFATLKATVNLFTLKSNFSAAMDHFDQIDQESRFVRDGALFPDLELRLFEIENQDSLQSSIESLETDIAIIPQLLEGGDDYHRQVAREDDVVMSGAGYEPLYDAPVSVKDSGTEKISIPLRPEKNDALLDSWSTLVTRQKDLAPVSTDGSGCDYYEKKINFKDHILLFEILHDKSHWVITAERYLKREQLKALRTKPEIISFRDGLGPGGNYSIIVSSNSGRRFVVSRLTKKLERIFGDAEKSPQRAAKDVAESVYERAREITPELALDALGVARVSEEILGLAVARQVVDQLPWSEPESGYTAWISLDGYKEWFTGGESSTRADMVKVMFDTSGPRLRLGVVVLESKLRKDSSFVEHAVLQVGSTLDLLEKFLSDEHKKSKHDAKFWRDEFLRAVRNSGDRAIRKFGAEDKKAPLFDLSVGDDFRNGEFDLTSIIGLSIQSVTSGDIPNSVEIDTGDSRVWRVKVGMSGILRSFDDESPLSEAELKKLTSGFKGPLLATGSSDPIQTEVTAESEISSRVEVCDSDDPEPLLEAGKHEPFGPKKLNGKCTDEELRDRYQHVLDILSSKLKLPISAVEWDNKSVVEGPSSFLFRIRYEGANPKEVEAKHDALKLNLGLDEDQSINFSIGSGFINIDVPKKDDERYFVTTEDLWQGYAPEPGKLSVPLGVDRFGQLVVVHFSDSDSPHLLIGGTTGSGKSEAIHSLLCGMCHYYSPDQVELLLVDPKGTEMEMYQNTDYVTEDIAMFEDEAMRLIQKAVDEMQSRFLAFRQLTRDKGFRVPDFAKYNEVATEKLPWIVVVIDEYADITSDRSFKKEFENQVKRVAQKGRSAGIHLVVATQKPSAEVISTSLRSNLPAQIALRVKGFNESKVIIEESGAEGLIGKGDAIFKSQSSTRRVQCGKINSIKDVVG